MMNVSFVPWQLLTVIALTKHWSMLGKLVLWPKFIETLTQIRNLYELNHDWLRSHSSKLCNSRKKWEKNNPKRKASWFSIEEMLQTSTCRRLPTFKNWTIMHCFVNQYRFYMNFPSQLSVLFGKKLCFNFLSLYRNLMSVSILCVY